MAIFAHRPIMAKKTYLSMDENGSKCYVNVSIKKKRRMFYSHPLIGSFTEREKNTSRYTIWGIIIIVIRRVYFLQAISFIDRIIRGFIWKKFFSNNQRLQNHVLSMSVRVGLLNEHAIIFLP